MKPNQSLKSVIKLQQLCTCGEFDVYDQAGKVISNEHASQHRDSTVYVGVARVAGGAYNQGFDLDDDDDDGWDLDDDAQLVKPREVIFILQDESRVSAVPNDGELLIQAYHRVNGQPRDGSQMEISDAEGNPVSSRIAKDMIGIVPCPPPKVCWWWTMEGKESTAPAITPKCPISSAGCAN